MATTLNPTQYAALDAMGIPVWQANTDSPMAMLNPVHPEPVNHAQDEQNSLPLLGNPEAPLLFIGAGLTLDGATASSCLFLAMLAALGLDEGGFAVLPWQSTYHAGLQTYLETTSVTQIVMLGAAVSQDCFEQQSIDSLRSQKQDYANIDTWVSYHPDELLKQASNKSVLWQDLRHLSRA